MEACLRYLIRPLLIDLLTTLFEMTANTILRHFYPRICWHLRIGGFMVGISVFAQGYLEANPDLWTATV